MLPLRLVITATLLCHLLLAPQLVTSQLRPNANAAQKLPNARSGRLGVPVTIEAIEQEKDAAVYKLRGKVKVDYGTYTIHADSATYNSDTGELEAEGNLLLEARGPVRIFFRIFADENGMRFQSQRASFWIIPLPLQVEARVRGDESSWEVDVTVGRIGSYHGALVPVP